MNQQDKEENKPTVFLSGSPDYRLKKKGDKIFIFIDLPEKVLGISLHKNYLQKIISSEDRKSE